MDNQAPKKVFFFENQYNCWHIEYLHASISEPCMKMLKLKRGVA
jgi:hypothetical protein